MIKISLEGNKLKLGEDKMKMFKEIVRLQHNFNTRVFKDYRKRKLNWNSAIIAESGELLESLGYKWWKKQQPDMDNVKVEAIDLLHFVISEEIQKAYDVGETGEFGIECVINDFKYCFENEKGICDKPIDKLIDLLNYKQISRLVILKSIFTKLDMTNEDIYLAYIIKNCLNEFRQKHGYKDGTYIKDWNGKEDNEIAYEIASEWGVEDLTYEQLFIDLEAYYKTEVLKG